MKMFVLKIGIYLYPVLNADGMGMNASLAVCVKNEDEARVVFHELSGFGMSGIIPLGLPKKDFMGRIEKADYELIPISCDRISKDSISNIEAVKNAMISKMLNSNKFYGLPVIVFYGAVNQDLAEFLSGKCFVNCNIASTKVIQDGKNVRDIIESIIENLSVIEYEISNLAISEGEVAFLRGAAEACKVLINKDMSIADELYWQLVGEIDKAVESLETQWEIVGDYTDWHDLLRDQFLKAANRFIRIIDRNAVSYGDEVLIQKYPVYDEKFYYGSVFRRDMQ